MNSFLSIHKMIPSPVSSEGSSKKILFNINNSVGSQSFTYSMPYIQQCFGNTPFRSCKKCLLNIIYPVYNNKVIIA